jgi:hypothetical protein
VFSLPGAYSRVYDLFVDCIDVGQEAFVVWVAARLTGWSQAEERQRLAKPPRRVQHAVDWSRALWAYHRFRGRAEVRVAPSV